MKSSSNLLSLYCSDSRDLSSHIGCFREKQFVAISCTVAAGAIQVKIMTAVLSLAAELDRDDRRPR